MTWYRIHTIFFVAILLATPILAQSAILNELRIDQPGADFDEYAELTGQPGESLNNISLIVIGDGPAGHGSIENVTPLDGYAIQPDGFFVIAETGAAGCGGFDAFADLNFENSDNLTILLVSGFSGAVDDDVDSNNDGVMDNTPWTAVLDGVALIETIDGGDAVYSEIRMGPVGGYVPGHVLLCDGFWSVGNFDLCLDDTPGADNGCIVEEKSTNLKTVTAFFR